MTKSDVLKALKQLGIIIDDMTSTKLGYHVSAQPFKYFKIKYEFMNDKFVLLTNFDKLEEIDVKQVDLEIHWLVGILPKLNKYLTGG